MSLGFLVGILLQLQIAKWLLINRWLLLKPLSKLLLPTLGLLNLPWLPMVLLLLCKRAT